ncbi:hypothetical protein GA0115235_103116 [Streptomyces sp. DpondAA-F4a]|nr:hypothetical protein GA0115235_103116 [Streptomyces sp. DpondAA-F4a]
MAKLTLPPAVRPWTDSDPESLRSRFSWMRSRLEELTEENNELRRSVIAGRPNARAGTDVTAALPAAYRRARRVVGRPVRRILRPER